MGTLFWTPLCLALGLLTRIPCSLQHSPSPCEVGRSVLYYPVVGAVLGGLLWCGASLLGSVQPLLLAALLLTAWVWLTGGLHLDGVADCADARVGGMGSAERTLAIMKDPTCGPAAVTSLVLLLLLQVAALHSLLQANTPLWYLLFIPTWGRMMMVLLLATTPYVRREGMGAMAAAQLSGRAVVGVALSVLAVALLVWRWQEVLLLAGIGVVLLLGHRHHWQRRIGGCTGDVAGALCSWSETAMLVGLALWQSGGAL
uniref:Adenosylcobinamide-GDP ribazoletransferase n=1 Tax=Magnetococcus massalia (strain MO-1) TaxID=451514 RepID=A0A1S7LQZ7_MAGMO|nr:Cobalamin synthase [Candidatus Magnetococcus massalia]